MSRRASAGFTLLELMVSLAVAALAVLCLTHLVQDASSLDARLSNRERAALEAEALFSVLGQLLGDPPYELRGEALGLAKAVSGPSVSGTAHKITVVSRGPRVLDLPGAASFTLGFAPGSTPERGRIDLDWSNGTGISEPELVARSRGLDLRYAARGLGGELAWFDSWSRPVVDLALVEVSIIEAVSGRRLTRVFPVVPSLPRICVLRPLLDGCPQWH